MQVEQLVLLQVLLQEVKWGGAAGSWGLLHLHGFVAKELNLEQAEIIKIM